MNIKDKQKLLSKYKKNIKPTKEEYVVEGILKYLGVKYMPQKGFLPENGTCFIADFYLPRPHKVIIEVDGSFHIGRESYDASRDNYFLKERGIRTLRIKNEELSNLDAVTKKIKEFL